MTKLPLEDRRRLLEGIRDARHEFGQPLAALMGTGENLRDARPGVLASYYLPPEGKAACARLLKLLCEETPKREGLLKRGTASVSKLNIPLAKRNAARMRAVVEEVIREAESLKGVLPDGHRFFILTAARNALHPLRSIEALDFSLRLARKEVDLRELVRREFADGLQYRDKHGRPVEARLRLPKGLNVLVDPEAFSGVVRNLRSDASIHPEARGGVRLSVSAAPEGDFVRLRFVSLGAKPLSSEVAAKIGRVPFTTRTGARLEEHGRGKVISRRVVEALGGSFRACNHRGAPCLEVRLPRSS
ncbi:MAG: hypothetical protein AABW54_01245 [Candidatus Micrarchaeota archaeon]